MSLTIEDREYLHGVLQSHLIQLRIERRDAKEIKDHQVVDELDETISYVKTLMSKINRR